MENQSKLVVVELDLAWALLDGSSFIYPVCPFGNAYIHLSARKREIKKQRGRKKKRARSLAGMRFSRYSIPGHERAKLVLFYNPSTGGGRGGIFLCGPDKSVATSVSLEILQHE